MTPEWHGMHQLSGLWVWSQLPIWRPPATADSPMLLCPIGAISPLKLTSFADNSMTVFHYYVEYLNNCKKREYMSC